jgi:glycosyltransferase involved in cell wall biosynthesis
MDSNPHFNKSGIPLVDIVLIAYNHERYVGQAIESVLAQQTDFAYRLIIGDDCSTDNTQAIIKSYAEQYPNLIKTMLDSEHRGFRHKDRVGIKALDVCNAKYVAFLDGDDYWTDPSKLQKQVAFLETHPDFSICYHNARMFYEDGSRETTNWLQPDHKEVSTLEDLLFVNFIPTCSVVFRRGLLGEWPDWLFTLGMADWPIHIMNAQHGKIEYLNEVMATYRVHDKGTWSSRTQVEQWLDVIRMLDHINVYLGLKYKKQVRAAKAEWYYQLAQITEREGDRVNARMFFGRYCRLSQFRDGRRKLSIFLRCYLPGLYRGLRTFRNRVQPNGTSANSPLANSTGSKGE